MWYSLRVISGKEQATKENILREAEEASIEQDIEEVFLPYEKVVEAVSYTHLTLPTICSV